VQPGYTVIREYFIDPEFEREFRASYEPGGTWAVLMSRHAGYPGTELVRYLSTPLRYVTIDRWRREPDWQDFRKEFNAEYEEIDRHCEQFTTAENQIGTFTSLGRGGPAG